MNEMIAFALCGLIAFHLGLFLQKFIMPKVTRVTGFPFGVTAILLGIGIFFRVYAFLADWIAPLFIVFLAVFLLWRLWAVKLVPEEEEAAPAPVRKSPRAEAPETDANGRPLSRRQKKRQANRKA